MRLEIRPETGEDWRGVEALARMAFWNVHEPGCCEHLLVYRMRSSPSFLSELSRVALVDDRLVGCIFYTRARIERADGDLPVLCFGPIAVLPEWQGRGVGGALIEQTTALARSAGWPAILIYGDPDYYGRFGFVAAERFGIRTEDGQFADALLALPLCEGALDGAAGRFFEDEVFHLDGADVEAFDRNFPHMEKGEQPSQARFRYLVAARHA